MTFIVACGNEQDSTFDFIVKTAKSYGAERIDTNEKPKTDFGILITQLEPYIGQVVCLNNKLGTPLSEFEHPEKATYMVGGNKPTGDPLPDEAIYVKVETPVDYPLWNFIALALVLDDRNKKVCI